MRAADVACFRTLATFTADPGTAALLANAPGPSGRVRLPKEVIGLANGTAIADVP